MIFFSYSCWWPEYYHYHCHNYHHRKYHYFHIIIMTATIIPIRISVMIPPPFSFIPKMNKISRAPFEWSSCQTPPAGEGWPFIPVGLTCGRNQLSCSNKVFNCRWYLGVSRVSQVRFIRKRVGLNSRDHLRSAGANEWLAPSGFVQLASFDELLKGQYRLSYLFNMYVYMYTHTHTCVRVWLTPLLIPMSRNTHFLSLSLFDV